MAWCPGRRTVRASCRPGRPSGTRAGALLCERMFRRPGGMGRPRRVCLCVASGTCRGRWKRLMIEELAMVQPRLESPAEAVASEAALDRVAISLRPIGAPLSIGLYSLAAATFVLASLQLGWIAAPE